MKPDPFQTIILALLVLASAIGLIAERVWWPKAAVFWLCVTFLVGAGIAMLGSKSLDPKEP